MSAVDARAIPAHARCSSSRAVAARAAYRTKARQPLTLLFGVTAIVLLICCANVANLLLGRAARRSTEMAVRLSIGAGRRHIVGPAAHRIAAAGAIAGGVGGLLVARWTLTAMSLLLARTAQVKRSTSRSTRTCLLVAAGLSVATGLLFGLFPALHSTRPNLVTALKANAGQPSGAKGGCALPRHARDGANRAVDGAARRRRAVHEEPARTSRASILDSKTEQRRRVWRRLRR